MMNSRQHDLEKWLKETCQLRNYQLQPMLGDASFRRYFRIRCTTGSYVVMDAFLERKSCLPYVAIANALRAMGLCTPEIIASDMQNGFLLLTDFGEQLFLTELNKQNVEKLYSNALAALAILRNCREVAGWKVPFFTADFMRQELQLFQEWFLQKHLRLTLSTTTKKMLATCFDFLADCAMRQPQVFMHRDYHSANLLVLPQHQVGILDFQDAFLGPLTYDLVSLLRDCYIAWPEDLVIKLVLHYRERLTDLNVSSEEFLYWFDVMGMQRHMKALMTFSRKYHRDNNPHYLQHIPRTLNYIATVSARYPECCALGEFLSEVTVCVE